MSKRTVQRPQRATQNSPQRRCVVCASTFDADRLVRFSLLNGHIVIDKTENGRSAYVCNAAACLRALTPKHLARSQKTAVESFDVAALIDDLHRLAERRTLETIGLARRSGAVDVGTDDVLRALSADANAAGVVVAADLSASSLQRFPAHVRFISATALGAAAGMGRVGAMRITNNRLAGRLNFWLQLWHETHPHDTQHAATSQNAVAAPQTMAGKEQNNLRGHNIEVPS